MVIVKTNRLLGLALDWAHAVAEKFDPQWDEGSETFWFEDKRCDPSFQSSSNYRPSLNGDIGLEIIDRKGIDLRRALPNVEQQNPELKWKAEVVATSPYVCASGPSPLIAVVRCSVEMELGPTVSLPNELLMTMSDAQVKYMLGSASHSYPARSTDMGYIGVGFSIGEAQEGPRASRTSMRDAIAELVRLGPEELASGVGHLVVTTSDVLAVPHPTQTPSFQRWFGDSKVVDAEGRPFLGNFGTFNPDKLSILASAAAAGAHPHAQAWHDRSTNTTVFLADRISAGREAAVFLHEIVHRHGPQALPEGRMDALVGQVKAWAWAEPSAGPERAIHEAAAARVAAAGVAAEDADEELFAYAVEEAVAMGIEPSAASHEGSAEAWLQLVVDSIQRIGEKLIGNDLVDLGGQDLVDLAYALAQLESPQHGFAVRSVIDDVFGAADEAVSDPERVNGTPLEAFDL